MTKRIKSFSKIPKDPVEIDPKGATREGTLLIGDDEADRAIGDFVRHIFKNAPSTPYVFHGQRTFVLDSLLDWVFDRLDQNQIPEIPGEDD
jgi:hypothetical protein